jgi:hypothetical protein
MTPLGQPHDQPTTASRTGRITATSGVATVAATSAVISYNHVRHLALRAGETELAALLLPLALDGAIVAAVAVILADSRAGRRPAALTWVHLALGLIGSLSANIASAAPTLTARAVAAWPPLLLAVGVEVLANLSRRSGSAQRSDIAEQFRDAPDLVPAGGTGTGTGQATERPELSGANLAVLRAEQAAEPNAADASVQDRARYVLDRWSGTGAPCSGPHLATELAVSTGYARRLIRLWKDNRARQASEPRQLAQYRSSRATTGAEYPLPGEAELDRDPLSVQA